MLPQKRKGFYDKINQSAFDSYSGSDNFDPDMFVSDEVTNGYDPDYAGATASQAGQAPSNSTNSAATNVLKARPGQKLQINLTLNNPTAVKITFEIFSALDSWANIYKPALLVGAYTVIPALSTQGLATIGVGTVGYDQTGTLSVYGAGGNPIATIGCGEYPYQSLVESTKTAPFKVVFMRIAVQTDLQLNNQIIHFTQTFGGGYKQNQINVRSYKKPTQFQNLEVDTLAPYVIDGEKGLLYALEIGEVVQMGLFINRWAKPQV